MNDAFMEASIQDMSLIFPLMYVVMIVAMLRVSCAAVTATAAIVAIVMFSSGVTLGVAGWLGYPLTPPSAAAPDHRPDPGRGRRGAPVRVGAGRPERRDCPSAKPSSKRSASTFAPSCSPASPRWSGFACLNFAEAAPYWHLANMTVVGIAAAFLYSVTFLPVVLSLVKIRAPRRAAKADAAHKTTSRAFVIRFRPFILAGGAIVTTLAWAGAGGPACRPTTDSSSTSTTRSQFRPDAEFMLDELGRLCTPWTSRSARPSDETVT